MCSRYLVMPPRTFTPPPRPAQVRAKYTAGMVDCFRELFCALPLAYCLNGRVLVLHGGLFSQDGVTLEDLRKVDRFR